MSVTALGKCRKKKCSHVVFFCKKEDGDLQITVECMVCQKKCTFSLGEILAGIDFNEGSPVPYVLEIERSTN